MTRETRTRLLTLRRAVLREDSGTSLIELVVGMLVMGIFMTIFSGAIVSMAGTLNQVEAVTSSASQVNNAFLRLDKLVRYADAITTVGRSTAGGGDWYVELDFVDSVTAKETCTQLRVGGSKLQLRSWTAVDPTTSTDESGWTTLASNIRDTDANGVLYEPFSIPVELTAASTAFQRLTISLVAGTSGPSSDSTTSSAMTFTALNSSAALSSNDSKCQQLTNLRP